MKKIFAFVLATIMVLSLVPASAFAAFTKCPTTHTSTNCDAKLVQTVLADCQNPGYQVYVCNDCGEQFLDNFVAKLAHAWVSDKENAAKDIPASCVYKTDGEQYVICAVCEETDVIKVDYRSIHKLTFVSGIGCEKVYACSECEEEGFLDKDGLLVPAATHQYEYKSIITEPFWKDGVATNGLARYECKVEGCKGWKEVEIICPDCKCTAKKVLVSAAVAVTCDADGAYAVYKCPDCSTLYYDIDKDDKNVSYTLLPDVNGDKKITVEDAIIESKGHTAPANFTTAGCTRSYTCTVCKVAVVEEWHASYTDTIAYAPTCVTFGITYRACTTCGMQWPVMTDPLGHTEDTLVVGSNCAIQGGRYTYCTNEKCPLGYTVVNDPSSCYNNEGKLAYSKTYSIRVVSVELFPLNSSIHVKVNSMEGNTGTQSCTTSSLSVYTCLNNCAEYAQPKVEYKPATNHKPVKWKTLHNCSVASATLGAWTTRTIYKCEACNLQVHPTTLKTGDDQWVETLGSSITTTFATEWEALEYHGNLRQVWGYNDDDKLVPLSVEWRNDYSETNHTLSRVEAMDIKESCVAAGRKAYICTDCGVYAFITIPATKHVPVDKVEGKKATCNTPGIKDSYTCDECGVTCGADGKALTSLVINPCGSTLETVKNCKGTKFYKCTECGTYYTSTACTTKASIIEATSHNWKNAYKGVAATCNSEGVLEVRYCKDCVRLEVNALYIKNGEEFRLNYGKWDGAYKKAAKNCTISDLKVVSNVVKVSIAKNGTVTFTCDTVTTSNCPVVVKKLEHTVPVKGADAWASAIVSTPTYNGTPENHEKVEFTHNICSVCDYEFISSYIPAYGYHMNSKGNILTTECENEGVAGGRVCVLCVKAGLSESAATINVAHKFTETKGESTATCIKNGVTYQYCTECGHYELTSDIAFADAKAFHEKLLETEFEGYDADEYTVGTTLDYANNGASYFKCPECGEKLTDLEEEEMKANGLEIYLSTDAQTYIPGSKVFVTVSLDSLNGVNVWGLNFPVIFNPEVFKFEGFEFNTAESEFQTFAVNEVPGGCDWSLEYAQGYYGALSTGNKTDSGVLSIVANADGNVLVKGEQTLVVLEFSIISADAGSERFEVGSANVYDVVLGQKVKELDETVGDTFIGNLYTIETINTRSYNVDVINANGKAVDTLYNETNYSKYITITSYLDLTGDDEITMADAYELYSLIYNNEYDVKADADFDGSVTAKDLSMLYAILTGAITVEQLVTPDAELPEGFEAWMGAK